ncbi:rhamnogalacturonan lyase B N-terminal domain-containing protein [Actinoplanes rectilineatus]|uniref:rhamnogalacturonan lyase B N-terminal domain-containing protein n=1 Tax=Actinoplanes rectilineatus TaxID=113571 RepID=UPI0009FA3386|nr:rhamnogalacturonan lyase B N-terminal domain-containing protein [Actinoplanes rectilineatus]
MRRKMITGSVAAVALVASVVLAHTARAATFGVTESDGAYIVDTGAGLMFTVSRTNGDMTSMTYEGRELLSGRASHVQSGFGSDTEVTAEVRGDTIVVTEHAPDFYTDGEIYHYLVVREDQNNIYMATWVDAHAAGELRWYSSFRGEVLTGAYEPSDTAGDTVIESADVFRDGGRTSSKYYSNRRAIDQGVRGLTGDGVGVFMDYGNRESSSGGPFFRDIEQQRTGNNDLYNYLFSGHNQTEGQRTGELYGPYALMVTDGSTPKARDLSFMYDLNLHDAVGPAGRGWIVGKVSGVDRANAVVGWSNPAAQYWTRPDASTGNFASPLMKPGSYTQTLYQGELAVARRSVTVAAGTGTTGANQSSTWAEQDTIVRLGEWDGTPAGFKNAAESTSMHPSDSRLQPWRSAVTGSQTASFPAAQWSGINNGTTVTFDLTEEQLTARTVRIGITAAFAGGRPQISINDWTPKKVPAASAQPKSRSLTIGTYRGNNTLYEYAVPASALVAGTNTLTITVVSGSTGTGYLSPGFSYDAVDLY